MRKRKSISVIPFFFATALLLISCGKPVFQAKNSPPDLGFAKGAVVLLHELENPEANEEGWLTREVSSAEQLLELNELLTQNTSGDLGDCGFGELRLIFTGEGQSVMILPALDGCPTMYVAYGMERHGFYGEIRYYNENYYSISHQSKKRLNAFLVECFPTASKNWSWNMK